MKGVAADGKLTLRVKDYDTFGSDDDIGELVISMDDVKAQISREGSKACWKKLSGVGAGDGELCVGFEVEGGATKASPSSSSSSASLAASSSSSSASSASSSSSSASKSKDEEYNYYDDSDDDSADEAVGGG